MLTHLQIQDFAIVKSLDIEFLQGMTTITGETGAGKSIAIDALSLCLGGRAEPSMIRPNEQKTDIIASFSLSQNPKARDWLINNELFDGDECILRRVITREGRSRAFINGKSVPVSQQKSLGQLLINIHGQHAHQLIMKNDHQLTLLDEYAGHTELLNRMRSCYEAWQTARHQFNEKEKEKASLAARKQLLDYQINEFNELALGETEFNELDEEHKRLSNLGDMGEVGHRITQSLTDDEHNALQHLTFAITQLERLTPLESQFQSLMQMLQEAHIQVQECSEEIHRYFNDLEVNPERLHFLDQRLSTIMHLSRKHQVPPSELYNFHQNMKLELARLNQSDLHTEELHQQVNSTHEKCMEIAHKLSQSRQKFAKKLNKDISDSMHLLSMEKGQFHIDFVSLDASPLTSKGKNKIEFMVSTNPGQPLSPLGKVASGGELSRISLAIQVITAQKVETPSLIFDEVDVGISGPTAAIVGKLLRQLGESTQVMCVTHLPQVAGAGHHQLFVSKSIQQEQTITQMTSLDTEARILEIARLLGGSQITASTLANAKELLMAA